MTTDEAAFLAGIRAEPKDDLRRLVYADWLDEQADEDHRAKAEYLRLEVHVSGLPDDHPERDGHILKLRELAEGLPVEWKNVVTKAPIVNCGGAGQVVCPRTWDRMDRHEEYETLRFCPACRNTVGYFDSVEIARHMIRIGGMCVALDNACPREEGDIGPYRERLHTVIAGEELVDVLYPPGAPGEAPEPPPQAGLLRRLWRTLTGR